jgi:hypothetical protein
MLLVREGGREPCAQKSINQVHSLRHATSAGHGFRDDCIKIAGETRFHDSPSAAARGVGASRASGPQLAAFSTHWPAATRRINL